MSNQKETTYILELSPTQARVLCNACELYTRLHIGQFDHLIWEFMNVKDMSHIANRNDVARSLLSALRALYFPDLGTNTGASYGVGHDEQSDIAWDIYQVVRHVQAWHEHPEGGYTVNFHDPLQTAQEPLAKCAVREPKKKKEVLVDGDRL